MAGCDYYSCDVCGCKTFYDAELNYDSPVENPDTGHCWPNGNIGYMLVICKECAAKNMESVQTLRTTAQGMKAAQKA